MARYKPVSESLCTRKYVTPMTQRSQDSSCIRPVISGYELYPYYRCGIRIWGQRFAHFNRMHGGANRMNKIGGKYMNKKLTTVLLLFTVVVLIGLQEALALSGYLNSFNTKYGTSSSRLDTCGLCHIDPAGGGPKNSYGTDFTNYSHNFTAIEKLDSDKDGYSNIVEIRAR